MTLTDYTSYAEVRAAMGVDDQELEDDTLGLELYSTALEEDLDSLDGSLIQTYAGIKDTAEADRSVKEARVYRLTRLFATYSVAKQLGSALPMFGPKSLSDGKASMSRFSGEPYKKVLEGISEQYDLYRGRLAQAISDLSSSVSEVAGITVLRVSTPAYDPVTGEGG